MPSGKPIKITLFHANWCGHCTNFMPTWETMKSDKSSHKNIVFEEHEEGSIEKLDEAERSINGRDVRSFGYPTIKITVNKKEYMYQGRRTVNDIYGSIIEEIKLLAGVDGPVTVTKSERGIDISTSEEDAGNYQNETLNPNDRAEIENSEIWERHVGGRHPTKSQKDNKTIFTKRLNEKDFKSFIDAKTFSEVIKLK